MQDGQLEVFDFGLAAYLSTQSSVSLVHSVQVSPSRIAFNFAPKPECERLATRYFSDQATCNPRQYYDRCRALKSLIHQLKRGVGT